MDTGYEDIEKLTTSQNEMLDNALQQQQDITNKQTELNVAELQRNKEEVDKDVDKTNKALYAEYRKATNPYGSNAENLASQGLGNSGYAETTQTNLYNTYQKNITDTLNNARDLKADFDFQISKARQTGDITLAQNALEIYNQKMQLLTQEYELKNNREQFLYQKEQDALSQSNWEKEYAYQQQRDQVSDTQWQQTFDYQKQRDAVADNQWLQQFNLSKKKASSSGSSKNSLYLGNTVGLDNNNNNTVQQQNTAQVLLEKSLETAQQMVTEEGKMRFLDTMGNAMQKAVNSGKITENQMENIVRTVSNELYQSSTSPGGVGGGGGR